MGFLWEQLFFLT